MKELGGYVRVAMGLFIQKNEKKQDSEMSWTSSQGTVLETNRHEGYLWTKTSELWDGWV